MFILILSLFIILFIILFSVKLISDRTITFSYKEYAKEKIKECKNKFELSKQNFIIGIHFYKINNIPLINLIEKLPSHQFVNYRKLKSFKSFNRFDPLLIKLFNALNFSQEDIDKFFNYSANQQWVQ